MSHGFDVYRNNSSRQAKQQKAKRETESKTEDSTSCPHQNAANRFYSSNSIVLLSLIDVAVP